MPLVTSHRALSTVTRPQENVLQDTLKVGMQYLEQVLPATLGHLQVSSEVMTHQWTATVQEVLSTSHRLESFQRRES